MFVVLVSCLVLLLGLGVAERLALRRARARVTIRIHVNGTRGKSTVTRLVAAALREAGVPTVAKVTGTTPRLIVADGSEQAIVRRAPASIREQAWLLRMAARQGARAVVAECMAVRPELQWTSERDMVRATIGVITNVRLDHTDVMGRTLDDIGQSLANSIPRDAVLVTGARAFADAFARRCETLHTRLVVAGEDESGRTGAADFAWRENVAVALAVTRDLGIEDDVALRGMRKAAPDPGAATAGVVRVGDREVRWIDATAANDPESLDLLVGEWAERCGPRLKPGTYESTDVGSGLQAGTAPAVGAAAASSCVAQDATRILVYNHRTDRPERLSVFAESSAAFRGSSHVLITGERPSVTLVARLRKLRAGRNVEVVPARRLADAIRRAVTDAGSEEATIVYCGNTRGFARPAFGR